MKKIITMVGTSMFENYLKENQDDSTFRNYIDALKDRRADEYKDNKDRVGQIKQRLSPWLNHNENSSAEIKSLVKLKHELNESFGIYLLSSDTILSKLAGEILQERLPEFADLSSSEIHLGEIKGLQVWDRDDFSRKGMISLIDEIYRIASEYWNNLIINITGGYKATVPYLTIIAQVNRCKVYYIFEDTDALIEIPYIPLSIKWEIFKENEELFASLEREGIREIKTGNKYREEIEHLVERADNLISLNPLGVALWETYKQRIDIFYISELAKKYIEKKGEQYKKISQETFKELKRRLRKNPDNPDLKHHIRGVGLPQEFYCFKHKEDNLQVRVLYKKNARKTRYGSQELDIYIGLIKIGSDVHNVESEYIDDFKRHSEKIKDIENYKAYRIERQGGA